MRAQHELRFANLKNRGRPLNPSDAYPFPGGIDPPARRALKALIILVEFSDTTFRGALARSSSPRARLFDSCMEAGLGDVGPGH